MAEIGSGSGSGSGAAATAGTGSTGARNAIRAALLAYRRVIAIVLPTYAVVILLKHSPVFPWIVERVEPAMRFFGLPGEAALALVLGAAINIYAAIAASAGFAFTPGEATTLALMLGLAHNLFVESVLLLRLSRRAPLWIGLRIATAIAAGLLLGPTFAALWPSPAGLVAVAGGPQLPVATVPAAVGPSLTQELLVDGARYAVVLLLIIVPIVFLLHLLQDRGALTRLRAPIRPVLRLLGLADNAAEALLAGVFFGMVYGAGVIVDRIEAEGLDETQVGRLCVQLILFHAIVEDTLLFVALGAILWPVILARAVIALGIGLLVRLIPPPSPRPA